MSFWTKLGLPVAVGVTCSGGGSCIHNVGSVLCIMLSKPESVFF